jgi:hypothetical protein
MVLARAVVAEIKSAAVEPKNIRRVSELRGLRFISDTNRSSQTKRNCKCAAIYPSVLLFVAAARSFEVERRVAEIVPTPFLEFHVNVSSPNSE